MLRLIHYEYSYCLPTLMVSYCKYGIVFIISIDGRQQNATEAQAKEHPDRRGVLIWVSQGDGCVNPQAVVGTQYRAQCNFYECS